MSTEMSCHFIQLLQVTKKQSLKSDFIQFIFMTYFMYLASGQGQTTPRGQNFDVNRKALSLYPFVAGFKEISLKSYFIHFFSIT